MKKIHLVVLSTIFFTVSSFAQKGNNAIGLGADLSFPTADFGVDNQAGLGAYAKLMYGVAASGQLTFTLGYSFFKDKGSTPEWNGSQAILPFLAGYRHYFKEFFVEPQIGYGSYINKSYDEVWGFWKESTGAFTWALGGGYVFKNNIEVSARYQSGSRWGGTSSLFGLRVGYNFSLAHSK